MDNQENAKASVGGSGQPGFFDLAKISLILSFKNILKYIGLAIVLALPVIIVGALAGFLMARLSFAKPQMPTQPPIEAVVSEDVVLPDRQLPATAPLQEVPVVDPGLNPGSDPLVENNPAETAPVESEGAIEPLGEPKAPSVWDSGAEGVGPSKTAETQGLFGDPNAVTGTQTPFNLGLVSKLFLSGSLALSGIFILLALLYQMVASIAFLRLTVLIERGEAIHFGQMVGWSFRKLGSFVLLAFRIFAYSFIWVLIVGMLIYTILTYASSLEISVPIWVSYGIGLASLLSIPIIIFRGPKVLFAQYALVDRECSSKEALLYSVQITKGHWWKTVLYVLAMSLLSALLVFAVQFAVLLLVPLAALIVSPALSIYLAITMMIFMMGLYRLLEMLFGAKQQQQ